MKQLSKTYCFLITINNIRLISMLLILALSVLIKLSQVFMFKGDNHIIIYLFNNEAKLTIVFQIIKFDNQYYKISVPSAHSAVEKTRRVW